MEETSFNSCSATTEQYRTIPQIHFPPPPMQSSSAYECYANVIIPKRRMPIESVGHVAGDIMHESLANEYPQSEIYYDHYIDNYGHRQSISLPCYECIEMQNMPVYYKAGKSHDDYDIYSQRRFGLSKKGLLQIDYSLSWINLQRQLTI